MTDGRGADYIVSGQFAGKAYDEAKKFGSPRLVASSKSDGFTYVPRVEREDIDPNAAYLHICHNNTIFGTRYNYIPDTADVPIVADMSSSIISEVVDVSKYGVIYAGAQKNMAPAGLTVVIVRRDLLGHAREDCPSMLNWTIMAENGSMYNTPPCFAIYMASLVYEWILDMGGLPEMEKRNREKAELLYSYLDSQSFYTSPVRKDCRSLMNVTFVTGDGELDRMFATEAESAGLKNLKGHRSVGGMRASIYNAMPIEGVRALISFMEEFAQRNKKA
jgi:phosphoserine aminotransferase